MNAWGHVVGTWQATTGPWVPFLYRDGQIISLQPPAGWSNMDIADINDQDVLIGTVRDQQATRRAFKYDSPNDQWTLLPTTPDGMMPLAVGINNHGQVVGWIETWGAALWDSDGTLTLLNELIPPELGWDLQRANAINDLGVICGSEGFFGTWTERAFMLVPICAGDIVANAQIDLADLAAFLSAFGSCTSEATFDPAADINANGCIELDDLGELVAKFGSSCW